MSNQDQTPSQTPYEASEEDLNKWEKMYYSSSSSSQPSNVQFQSYQETLSDDQPIEPTASDIRVITFDLDNTLWKTGPTISYANQVLNDHVHSMGVTGLVEVEMGRIFEANKQLYAGGNFVEDDDNPKTEEELAQEVMNVGETKEDHVHIRAGKKKVQPVYLTMLRKDAIRSLLQSTVSDADTLERDVDEAFQLWMDARTQSITENYADNVLSTLSTIQSSIVPSPKFGKLYIGAITDGNSNPLSVPSIGEFFDFVVRAEDVGVSKPDGRVYKAAVAELMVTMMKNGHNVENVFLGESNEDNLGYGSAAYMKPTATSWVDVGEETVDAFAEAVGPWWVHVGDDFFKDIVASKEFRMRSVWVRELIAKKRDSNDTKKQDVQEREKRTVQDLEKEIAKGNGVLTMTIGESEFLANSLHEEFSDAILERFDELGDLLIGWHENGLRKKQSGVDSTSAAETNEQHRLGAKVVTNEASAPDTIGPTQTPEKHRFCVFCGEQLPAVAKFCSGCGEKQP